MLRSNSGRRAAKHNQRRSKWTSRRLQFERLETRQLLAVTLNPLNNVQDPGGKTVLVPLNSTGGGSVSYSFSSTDPSNVTLSLAPSTDKFIDLNVSGTDSNGNAFTGDIVIELFDDLAPTAASRIETLVNQGFYNGLDFFRVMDGFMAQAGSPTNNGQGGSSLGSFSDEFNPSLVFDSPGLMAMANSGPDTNDSQFFITAIDNAGSTTPITLANMYQPGDFKYTIFGQVVSGFDTLEKVMTTQVTTNSTGELSQPTHTVVINSASVVNDTTDAVLRVSTPAGYTGSATVTVTATGSDTSTSQQMFQVQGVADTAHDPPFLDNSSVANLATTAGQSVQMQLKSIAPAGDTVTYTVVSAYTGAVPASFTPVPTSDATVSIDQSTGIVTITPVAGFTGTLNLLAGVRDNIDHTIAQSGVTSPANYDTQAFTLTVNANPNAPAAPTSITLDSSSNTGNFTGFNYTSNDSPTIDITAATGTTVTLELNGKTIATATGGSGGQYTATIPAGTLAVGVNAITAFATNANGTSAGSTPLSITYAPDYSQVYSVPGVPGTPATLDLNWGSRNAAFNNEIGVYVVSALDGSVNGVAPGSPGYAQAALAASTTQMIFASGKGGGATGTMQVTGGQTVAFYLIQNNTTANFLANNPTDSLSGGPLAFFSVTAANPDNFNHVHVVANQLTGQVEINWEDGTGGGDQDFNDAVMTVALSTGPTGAPGALQTPGGGSGNTVTVSGTLNSGSMSAAPGDIGIFYVTDASGDIGSLAPGSAGYAAAALASGNFQVLFGAGATAGTSASVSVPAGKLIGFYTISSGATSQFLSANSANSASGGPVAFFSFQGANPDSTGHFRFFSPEGAASSSAMQLHLMDQLFGNDNNYDSLSMSLNIG